MRKNISCPKCKNTELDIEDHDFSLSERILTEYYQCMCGSTGIITSELEYLGISEDEDY